ncbi:PREDICTED: coiled-coil domain-containing protein 181-like isoform X1 [Branchiostoma belcheri]|uniref:Coiled-coil domain-containing protein 181 n=1 Tax=Branchiostoma belcheri TaxID=7741 RepID=A0A6P5AXH8_BRABE|nr:PREDICTED: coiled-coil domain-containing protein 181-like isoform X1 [Branchiostoma belcheri]
MSETVTVTETQPANADDFDDFEKALDSLIEEDDKKVDNKETSEEVTEDKIDKELEENEKEGQKEPEKSEEKPEEARAETPSGEKSDEDDYAITDEQRAAELALQQMKESLEYNDDDTLMDGDPPEYNVKERLKELNEELAKEPLVEEESRERKVLFKENLVDLEVPPPEYSDEEADGAAKTDTTENVAEDVKDKLTLSESESNSTENNAEATTADDSGKGEENGDGERVLVEREGKFELVHVSELQGEEEKIQQSFAPVTTAENNDTTQDNDNTDEADNDSSSTQRSQETNELLPRPPDKPRPATAAGVSRRPAKVSTPQRAQSASYTREEYVKRSSPYGLSDTQKKLMKERQKAIAERKRLEEERMKEEEQRRREEAEGAFQAWLSQKREQHRREKEELRRKKQLEQADQHGVSRDGKQSVPPGGSEGTDEDDDDPQEAYQEWLKAKRDQRKKEREIEEQRKREQEEGFYLRAREDCDKAYKQWLRRKNKEIQEEKMATKKKKKRLKSSERKSRKSQELSQAIRQAQAFRYVDYYGYRF